MTAREKLKAEYPLHIGYLYRGGCYGCPIDHPSMHLPRPEYCKDPGTTPDVLCAKCWDREIPEEGSANQFRGCTECKYEFPIVNNHCKGCDGHDKFEPKIPEEKSEDSLNYDRCPHHYMEGDTSRCYGTKEREVCGCGGDKAKCDKYPKKKPADDAPHILDSGNRREFETGAVRDIQEGKGRCDLLPLDVVAEYLALHVGCNSSATVEYISRFVETGDTQNLSHAIYTFTMNRNGWGLSHFTMLLEVAIHFEEGAKKYGENNWQKGIPVHCYIDSAVRHYLKFLRGDKDERHDRAFCWNIMCAIWTCKHRPELNEYLTEEK